MCSYFVFESDRCRSIMFLLELRTSISFSNVWARSTCCIPTWISVSSFAWSSFWISFWSSLAFWILVCISSIGCSQMVILLAQVSNSLFCSRLYSSFATLLVDSLVASHSADWVSIFFLSFVQSFPLVIKVCCDLVNTHPKLQDDICDFRRND